MAYFLRKIQTLRENNSRIVTIQNAKFSGYYLYMNLDIWQGLQICISVPLILEIQYVFLKYLKLNSLVNKIRFKVNITKFLMNTILRVFFMMTVPDIEKYCAR